MNALANSQLEELGKYMGNVAGEAPVTFARYTGQEKDEKRRRIAANPPDILLTNFMMLELFMTRQEAGAMPTKWRVWPNEDGESHNP